MTSKADIRRLVLEKRKMLAPADAESKSRLIVSRLQGLEAYKRSRLLMCYVSFRNEVATLDFINDSLAGGKRVAVPLVYPPGRGTGKLLACEITDPAAELRPGTMGILEPEPDRAKVVNPGEIDLAVVPGVAFDEARNRIGYGGGYYDRYLKRVARGCLKVGIAFELQMVRDIPAGIFDVPLDVVITEDRII